MPRASRPILPAFVAPMLAMVAEPFDSDRHWFELKWDGFRGLSFTDRSGYRLIGRSKADFTQRFPELDVLAGLPAGTILDGEIVQMTDGKPDFASLLKRLRSSSPGPSAAVFVAFDILYDGFQSVMNRPLVDRLKLLSDRVGKHAGPRLLLSEGRVGDGLVLFDHVNRMGLEGVVAKRLDGTYEPGRRSGSWSKFKRRQSIPCAIIGYLPSTTGGLKSLLLAADVDGQPQFIGQVGSGIPSALHRHLLDRFGKMAQQRPTISCNIRGARWVRPGLVCRVSFMEWTDDGKLRIPVFESLL